MDMYNFSIISGPNGYIYKVTPDQLHDIVNSADREGDYWPLGLFYGREGDSWVAIDNSNGCAWTEEFDTETEAIAWLNGEFEVGDDESYDDWENGSWI